MPYSHLPLSSLLIDQIHFGYSYWNFLSYLRPLKSKQAPIPHNIAKPASKTVTDGGNKCIGDMETEETSNLLLSKAQVFELSDSDTQGVF